MLSFHLKNKKKNENQDKRPEASEDVIQQTEKNLKHEIIASILKRNVQENVGEKIVTFADASSNQTEDTPTRQIENQSLVQVVETEGLPPNQKISQLIREIESTDEKMIIPSIDITLGSISYPLLAKIGEKENNIDFLEKLASSSLDILDKIVYERFAVCPNHPKSLAVNIRLYCPRCNSLDIEKLHLIEHRRCGYISERKNFESTPDGVITKCLSCKKIIRDMKKEIAIPAMWYRCIKCKEKFDDVSIKLHCRKFNHDFDMNKSHTIVIPAFIVKNLADNSTSSIAPILGQLKDLLSSYGFVAEENFSVTGKSGNQHHVNICGHDEQGRTVFIFVKNPNAESDNSELNSKIIEVLDTSPTIAILIGFPTISEKAKSITGNYNISLITEQEPKAILSSIDAILAEKIQNQESD